MIMGDLVSHCVFATELRSDFHRARLAITEMSHFIRQLQYFASQEVISCAWQQLEKFIEDQKGDLDSLIDAHQQYIQRIENKVLLRSHRPGREVRHTCPYSLECWVHCLLSYSGRPAKATS